ncbi:MAG: response regulator [Sphingobacteriales bacterium]|nr:MAG: response regulator [Sphingobacteriales bacterium]
MHDRKKVLIIDDEIDLCLLLKGYFLRKNYEVYLSHTLTEGVSFMKTLQPDIVFLDNNLPDGLGWGMAPQLAAQYPSTYINLISAFHPVKPEMPANARFSVIEKPISLTDLDRQLSEVQPTIQS